MSVPLLILALLLRFGLMASCFHSDLGYVHQFPHVAIYHGQWNIYGHFIDNFPALFLHGHFYYPFLTFMTIGLFQWVLRPLMPGFDTWMDSLLAATEHGQVLTVLEKLTAPGTEFLNLNLFMMKLPYLAFELFGLYLLLQMFDDTQMRKRAMLLWLFNPLLIFSSHMMGQIDVFAAVSVLASLWAVHKKRTMLAFLCLFAGFFYKITPGVLVLPLLACFGDDLLRQGSLFLRASLIALLSFVATYYLSAGDVLFSVFNGIVGDQFGVRSGHKDYGELTKTLIFATLYAGLCVFAWRYSRKHHLQGQERLVFVSSVFVLFFLSLYSLIVLKPHYMTWMTGPMIVLCCFQPRFMKPYYGLMVCALLYRCKRSAMSFGLFAPVNPEAFEHVPGLRDWVQHMMPYEPIEKTVRIVFVLVALWTMVQVFVFLKHKSGSLGDLRASGNAR